jgi:tetratricopeptide (TPR) repeat protein
MRLYVDVIHMVALAQPTLAKKIEWNLKGVDIVREHPDQKGWLYALYNNLGEAYASAGDDHKALETFEKRVAMDVENGKEPDLYARKDVAKYLRRVGRVDEAINILRPIDASLAKKGERDGFIEQEVAECLLAQGKATEAKSHAGEAYRLSQIKWVVELDSAGLERMKKAGTVA